MPSSPAWARRVRRFAAPILIVLALVIVPFLLFGNAIESWALSVLADPARRLYAAAVAAGLLVADIILPAPSSVLGVALGALLGAVAGTLACTAAMTLGALIGLWLGRRLGADLLYRRVGEEDYRWLRAALAGQGLWVIVACRPIPVLAEASVIVAGAARTPFWRTAGAIMLANIGVSAIYAGSGAIAMNRASLAWAFLAAILVPAAGWLIGRLLRSA